MTALRGRVVGQDCGVGPRGWERLQQGVVFLGTPLFVPWPGSGGFDRPGLAVRVGYGLRSPPAKKYPASLLAAP